MPAPDARHDPDEVRDEMITAALILLFGILIGAVLRSFPARRKEPGPRGPR